ncbi:hypothetical protein O181_012365 [Austropuccinia psidii MF-1]|uniref:Uncharacterized protein n=1 Tax=Austropuccinia psidii MF-1 TaxID=1389203 RepID=A0A9Q3BXV0_9BASI|nr:hypothetical protein [Austropuccinia psidii MF-1]
MKPQLQGHVMDNQYYQEDIIPDAMLMNKSRFTSQYQDGDNMSYSENDTLKQAPEASSWPKLYVTGEYDQMKLIDYIDEIFIDVPSISDYWITSRLYTEFKGHASIWYTKMKQIHCGRVKSSKSTAMVLGYGKRPCHLKMTNDIANTLQEIRKRINIGKYSSYKGSGFKEKQPFRVEFEDKPRERVSELTKKKNLCQNCGSADQYSNNCPKAKKKVYAIEKVPEEESPTEDSETDSMGDAIREQSDKEQEPREEFLVDCQEATPPQIQDIQLEAGISQDTANKNVFKHTQDAQKFLVTPTKGMAYIHGTATKMTVFIDNAQYALHIDSGAHFSIVARNYLDNDFAKWEKHLLPTKAKNFKSASGKMTPIGTIIKETIIPHRKGNIKINLEFIVFDDAHIQGFLLGTDYQRMYGIDIYKSKNGKITIGTNKEKKCSRDIYKISGQDPLEELLNEFREGQFSTTLGRKIRGHDIELYLDVERPYPRMLRRPPYPASLETRKEIEKHINELLDMDFIRKIGHNKIVEITTPFHGTWHDGKSRLCGDFRALNSYKKSDRYPRQTGKSQIHKQDGLYERLPPELS